MKHKPNTIFITLLLSAMLPGATSVVLAGNVTMISNPNTARVKDNANTQSSASISDVYSDIDMRLRLATKTSADNCVAAQCVENGAFVSRVESLGRYLTKAAVMVYPQHEQAIQRMQFLVVEKQAAGTASNNKGLIVVFRGVQHLQLSDDALSFVLAREMAHVIAGHHATNTSAKLIISALATVIFPAVAIIGASSTAAQASTITTLLTSAASTATSMVGSEVAMAKMKPSQLNQADKIACKILDKADWDMRSAANVLLQDEPLKSESSKSQPTKAEHSNNAWLIDLQKSHDYLVGIIISEDATQLPLIDDDAMAEDLILITDIAVQQ